METKVKNSSKILFEAMNGRGMKQLTLAEALDITQPSLSNTMNRTRISLDVFSKILDVLGYDVVVVDRENGDKKWTVIVEND